MAERVMSIYFEDNNIRILVANGKKVERWANMPLAPGLVSGGVIVDEGQVSKKIRELLEVVQHVKPETSGIQKLTESLTETFAGKGKIVVGLSGRDSLYRVLSLPPLPDSLLGEAVRREAGRVLPVSINELYLAYQRIPSGPTETRVFVAGFPRKNTDVLIDALHSAGVKPRVLDLAPLALSVCVNEPRAIIVDATSDSLNIIVLSERVPQVIRSLVIQGKNIFENMPTISEEFARTVAFYNSSHPQDPLKADIPVFVSSDLARQPDTWKALVGTLNSKVAVLTSPIQGPAEFPVNEYMVNLGLATKELELQRQPGNYSLVNLNALPASALPKPINIYRIAIPVVAVAGIVGVILIWNAWQNTKNSSTTLQSQLLSIQNESASVAKSTAAMTTQNTTLQAKIQPILDTANVLSTKLNTLGTTNTVADGDMQKIVALLPQNVALGTMTYSVSGIAITGTSASEADILDYGQALRDTGGFTIVVSSINYATAINDSGVVVGIYNFSFQLK